MKKWLCKKQRDWFCVDQPDLSDVYFCCVFVNPRPSNAAKMTAGYDLQCVCDSNHAWSGLKTKKYTTVNGTLSFNFNNYNDYDDYELCPTMIITSNANQNIRIDNNTTGEYVTINNCVADEVITIDSYNNLQESSTGRILVEDWNVEYLTFQSGVNNVTLTGDFTMELQYRLPIRIGG
jgi:hypothetical protein